MFAGIVEGIATVRSAQPGPDGMLRLRVEAGALLAQVEPGASVALNGVCLTVVERDDRSAAFDVVLETLQRSNLGPLQSGDEVNVERPLRADARIDGHFVQGHVDGVGTIVRVQAAAGDHRLWIQAPDDLSAYLVTKGSIAVDGVSLTVADVTGSTFGVAVIPTTLERTTLGARQVGDRVNIETDILARIVVRQLARLLQVDGDVSAQIRLLANRAADSVSRDVLRAAGLTP